MMKEDFGELPSRIKVQSRRDIIRIEDLMTDEEIKEKATQMGKELRELEDNEPKRKEKRVEWVEFRNQFTGEKLSLAVESYYAAYCQW